MRHSFIVTVIVLVFSALPVRAATYDFTDFYGKLKADEFYPVDIEFAIDFGVEGTVPSSGVRPTVKIANVVYNNETGIRNISSAFSSTSVSGYSLTAGTVLPVFSVSRASGLIFSSVSPLLNFPQNDYWGGNANFACFSCSYPSITFAAHPSGTRVSLPPQVFGDADSSFSFSINYKGNLFNVTNKSILLQYQGWISTSTPLTHPLTAANDPNFTGERLIVYRVNLKIPNEKGITRFLNPFDSCICGALCHHCCTCGWWDDVKDNERTGRSPHSCAEKHPSKCDHVRGDATGLLPGKTYCPYCCPCHVEEDDDDDDDDDDGDDDGEGHAKHVIVDNIGTFHGPGLPDLIALDLEIIDHFTEYDDYNYTFTYLTKTGNFSFTLNFVTLADRLTAAFGGVLPVDFAFAVYNVTKNVIPASIPLILQFDYTIFEGTPYAVHFATPPFDIGTYLDIARQLSVVPIIRSLLLALVLIGFMFNVFTLFFKI